MNVQQVDNTYTYTYVKQLDNTYTYSYTGGQPPWATEQCVHSAARYRTRLVNDRNKSLRTHKYEKLHVCQMKKMLHLFKE